MRGSGSGAEEEVGGRISEAASVVDPVAAHQVDSGTVLVGEDAPAVGLLLVHPAVAVERLADEGAPWAGMASPSGRQRGHTSAAGRPDHLDRRRTEQRGDEQAHADVRPRGAGKRDGAMMSSSGTAPRATFNAASTSTPAPKIAMIQPFKQRAARLPHGATTHHVQAEAVHDGVAQHVHRVREKRRGATDEPAEELDEEHGDVDREHDAQDTPLVSGHVGPDVAAVLHGHQSTG